MEEGAAMVKIIKKPKQKDKIVNKYQKEQAKLD